MVRYKHIDTSPRFLAVDRSRDFRHRRRQTAEQCLQGQERLRSGAAKIRQWLPEHPDDRQEAKGSVRKSNRTENDSAKMATAKGVLQGYTGMAAVDDRHQIIAEAPAHGTGSEQELLVPMIEVLIADNGMRGRDDRFAGRDQYKTLPDPLYDKSATEK